MDLTNRGARPPQSSNQQVISPNSGSHSSEGKRRRGKAGLPFGDMATTLLFIAAAIVLLGMTWLLIFSKNSGESKYVDTDKLQAVFLNGGQVYFGNITGLNSDYMRLNNIYYLRVNQQVQPRQGEQTQQDISLVKLGCELHGPEDQMVINQEQILFWENLKSDGKVTEAVKQYVEANPNGQDCSTQSDTSGSSGSPATGDGTTEEEEGAGTATEETEETP